MNIQSTRPSPGMAHSHPETAQVWVHQLNTALSVHAPLCEATDATPKVQHSATRWNVLSPVIQVEIPLQQFVLVTRMIWGQKVHPVRVLKPPTTNANQIVRGWVLGRRTIVQREQIRVARGQQELPISPCLQLFPGVRGWANQVGQGPAIDGLGIA